MGASHPRRACQWSSAVSQSPGSPISSRRGRAEVVPIHEVGGHQHAEVPGAGVGQGKAHVCSPQAGGVGGAEPRAVRSVVGQNRVERCLVHYLAVEVGQKRFRSHWPTTPSPFRSPGVYQSTFSRKNCRGRLGFTAFVTLKLPPAPKVFVARQTQLVMHSITFVEAIT